MAWFSGRRVFTLCPVLLLPACGTTPHFESNLRARYADDAGSVTVSPISVTRWEDVASELEPKFKMDSATALAEAMPTTQTFDQRLADVISANLQVALPTTVTMRSTTDKTDSDTGEVIHSIDNVRTRAAGDTSKVTPQAVLPGTAAALTALAGNSTLQDPMLRYLAATALQQEVALLNRYIRDRVNWPGSQAFLVRVQLAVLPNGRSLPYDVETDITLHAFDVLAQAGFGQDASTTRSGMCPTGKFDTLTVLPMVVTDNLERQQVARSTDSVRQLALSLLATVGNVGGSGQFARTQEALERTDGRDTNSLFTVSKLSDDTVRVRLGAVQSPRYEFVTVPRTHNISLVVIYRPCAGLKGGHAGTESVLAASPPPPQNEGQLPPRFVSAVTRSSFRDAMTGKLLPYKDTTERLNTEIVRLRHKYPGNLTYLELARMYQWAARQDHESFLSYIHSKYPDTRTCHDTFVGNIVGFPKMGWRLDPVHYEDMKEPGDHELLFDDKRRVLRDAEHKHQDPDRPTKPQDPRCLSLAQMRYDMIAPALWTELQSIRPTGEFAYTSIPIPWRRLAPALPERQIALLNQAADSSVTLSQGKDLIEVKAVQMTLIAPNGTGRLAATETAIGANGRTITGRFPPVSRLGIKEKDGFELEVLLPAWNFSGGCPVTSFTPPFGYCGEHYPVKLFGDAPAETSPYIISATATGVIADAGGHGRLNIVISKKKSDLPDSTELYVSVEGAEISGTSSVRDMVLSSASKGWKANQPGEATLFLENLIPNTVVKVKLEDAGKTIEPITRGIIAAIPTPK